LLEKFLFAKRFKESSDYICIIRIELHGKIEKAKQIIIEKPRGYENQRKYKTVKIEVFHAVKA